MSSVTLTSAMRNNLLSLRRLSSQMDKTQEILSTGKKVNSAIDNASNFYQARSLTNRAADLMELLNSMDQGIQTIEAANVGLEQGSAFLEQATAVATEALATVKIPAKEWFETQQNVAAVVSDWNELKAALDSGITGNIVIYGNIICEDSITLKDGQNLVGVGYYGVEDSEVDKFSQLNFDMDALGITKGIVAGADNLTIADLSIKTKAGYLGNFYTIDLTNTSGHTLHNVDILMDNRELKPYVSSEANYISRGIYGGSFTMTGVNNIADIADSKKLDAWQAIAFSEVVLEGQLNINLHSQVGIGMVYADLTTVENSELNIECAYRAVSHLKSHFTGNSKVNIQASIGIEYRECEITDNAEVNISAASSVFASYPNYPLKVNITSTTAKLNTSGRNFCSNSSQELTFNAVSGSEIGFNGKVYQAEKDVSDNTMDGTTLPQGFNEVSGVVAPEVPSLDWLVEQNQNRDLGWAYEKNQSSGQYQRILNEYDKLINDASYQGTNLLTGGKSEITFNETRSHQFTVAGKDMSAQALGLTTLDWQTQGDIAKSLSEIAVALNSIRNFQAELGNNYSIIQTRQDFTEALAEVLETGADDLTLADMNEESANYLMLQTRQQLAVNSLSLAAQSAQSILSVF